jgi:penicillin V acylase-like amidase (Ntn superfamily)
MTQWATFRDHGNKVYYYRTYEDMSVQALDLKKLDFSAGLPARRMAITTTNPGIHKITTDSMAAF